MAETLNQEELTLQELKDGLVQASNVIYERLGLVNGELSSQGITLFTADRKEQQLLRSLTKNFDELDKQLGNEIKIINANKKILDTVSEKTLVDKYKRKIENTLIQHYTQIPEHSGYFPTLKNLIHNIGKFFGLNLFEKKPETNKEKIKDLKDTIFNRAP